MDSETGGSLVELIVWTGICLIVILALGNFFLGMEDQSLLINRVIKEKDLIRPVVEIIEKEEFDDNEIPYYDGEISSSELLTFLYEMESTAYTVKIDNVTIYPEWIKALKTGSNDNIYNVVKTDTVYTRYYYMNPEKTITRVIFESKED